MMFDREVFELVTGAILSIAFFGLVLFHTGRSYAGWAKIASALACIAALGWAGLGFYLLHPRHLHISRDTYFALLAVKHLLGGVCIGLVFSVLLARPYRRRESLPRPRPNQALQPPAGRSDA